MYKEMKRCFISDSELLEKLCLSLYDVLRPLIIHIIHLETLSELCSILKNEMLEDHVQNNSMWKLFSLYLACMWSWEVSTWKSSLKCLDLEPTNWDFDYAESQFLIIGSLTPKGPLCASLCSCSVGGFRRSGEADAGGCAREAGLQDAHLHPDWYHGLQTGSRRSSLSWETRDDGGILFLSIFCFLQSEFIL